MARIRSIVLEWDILAFVLTGTNATPGFLWPLWLLPMAANLKGTSNRRRILGNNITAGRTVSCPQALGQLALSPSAK